jgi:uncharacterized coiled-coil protein SlyX
VEAAHIAWRPLGQLLVERGLLTGAELEHALAKQQQTGKRLGATIVECGFVSGPELESALSAQYGIELTTEKGFGTGLRSEIQRRHESDRRNVVRLAPPPAEEPSEDEDELAPAAGAEALEQGGDAVLLAQLEEQWAKLAAAEATLAQRERELREQQEINERLRAQLERLRLAPPIEDAGDAEDAATETPSSHLVFVQLDGRYELVSRDGPPPLASTELTLPDLDGRFVVAGSRRSPLPGDSRPCVFAHRAPGAE